MPLLHLLCPEPQSPIHRQCANMFPPTTTRRILQHSTAELTRKSLCVQCEHCGSVRSIWGPGPDGGGQLWRVLPRHTHQRGRCSVCQSRVWAHSLLVSCQGCLLSSARSFLPFTGAAATAVATTCWSARPRLLLLLLLLLPLLLLLLLPLLLLLLPLLLLLLLPLLLLLLLLPMLLPSCCSLTSTSCLCGRGRSARAGRRCWHPGAPPFWAHDSCLPHCSTGSCHPACSRQGDVSADSTTADGWPQQHIPACAHQAHISHPHRTCRRAWPKVPPPTSCMLPLPV
jgi:hypothetical protein